MLRLGPRPAQSPQWFASDLSVWRRASTHFNLGGACLSQGALTLTKPSAGETVKLWEVRNTGAPNSSQ